jgi:hypothetical protein
MYNASNPNALSDGDEKGKGENSGKIGSLTDINTRTESLSRNFYNGEKGYNAGHPNALSDGDDKGKGENSGRIGSLTDINTRTTIVAANKYNGSKGYPDF